MLKVLELFAGTRSVSRAFERNGKFSFEKLRIIIDCKEYDKKLWLLGLSIFDDKDGKSQRICVPFKTEPDMARIREQLENYPASVFLVPVMEAEK